MGDNEKVLSYGDVVLRKSDLKILQGPYYLNDRIIEFYFCYLSSFTSPKFLLVAPSVSFWILNAPDVSSIRLFVDPLKLPEKELVLFPINDNEDFSMAEGGMHWSLLVYDRKKNLFEHYDSSSLNKLYARKLFANIKDFMGPPAASVTFTEHFTPQQQNGYDCGIYVLAIAKELCSYGGESGEEWESVLKARVTSTTVSEMRNQILGIINDLSNQKARNTKFFKQQLQKIIKCCIQAGVPSPSQFPTNVSYEVRIEGKDRTIYNVYSLGPKNVVEIKLDSRWFEPKKPEAPIAMEKRSLKRKRENVPDSRRRKGYQKMQRINGPNSRKRVTNADNIQPRQQEEDCNGDPHGEGEEPTNDNNMDFISDKGNHDAEGEYQEPIEDMNSRPTYTLALRVKYYIARYSLFQIFGHHLDWQRLLQDVESNIADLEWDFCGQIFPLLDDEDDGGHGNKFKFPCDEEDGDHGDNFLFPDEEEDGDQGGDDNHNDEDEGRKIIEDIDDDLEEEEEEEEEKDTNSVNSDGSVSEEDTSCLPADWLPQEEDEDQEEDDDEEEEEDEDDDDDDDNEDDDDDDDNNEDEDIFGLMTPKFSLCLPPHVAEDEEWCSICQNSNPEVDESLNPLLLPCSHAYHPECITKWLASKNSCPLCRFKVSDKWNKASSRS